MSIAVDCNNYYNPLRFANLPPNNFQNLQQKRIFKPKTLFYGINSQKKNSLQKKREQSVEICKSYLSNMAKILNKNSQKKNSINRNKKQQQKQIQQYHSLFSSEKNQEDLICNEKMEVEEEYNLQQQQANFLQEQQQFQDLPTPKKLTFNNNCFENTKINQNLDQETKQITQKLPHTIYAQRMLQNIKNQNQILNNQQQQYQNNFLQNHQITQQMRAKMIDWMIEVMNSYRQNDQTLFLAINIMDRFFEKSKISQKVDELHKIGVTCMFIASKYEEVYPLKLDILIQKIAHNKLSKSEIKLKEIEILEALNYNISEKTLLDILNLLIHEINIDDCLEDQQIVQFWKQICVYMGKMTCYDYELLSKFSFSSLSASCVYVSFKILEQICGEFKLVNIVTQLKNSLGLDNQALIQSATHLLYLARNFQSLYQGLSNLKKFNADLFQQLQNLENKIQNESKENLKNQQQQQNYIK